VLCRRCCHDSKHTQLSAATMRTASLLLLTAKAISCPAAALSPCSSCAERLHVVIVAGPAVLALLVATTTTTTTLPACPSSVSNVRTSHQQSNQHPEGGTAALAHMQSTDTQQALAVSHAAPCLSHTVNTQPNTADTIPTPCTCTHK
jgi:hypothetical protein